MLRSELNKQTFERPESLNVFDSTSSDMFEFLDVTTPRRREDDLALRELNEKANSLGLTFESLGFQVIRN